MYRVVDEKGYGVLNDLDLSSPLSRVEQEDQLSLQRTGTPPYMAFELLLNIRGTAPSIHHLYRHDLESFTYVLLMFCSRNKFNPSPPFITHLTDPPFKQWFDPDLSWENLGYEKYGYLFNKPLSAATDVHPSFKKFVPWLLQLLFAFRDGLIARGCWHSKMDKFNARRKEHLSDGEEGFFGQALEPPPFDEKTLGGEVVYSNLLCSLSKFDGEKLEHRNKDV